ncbi:MAG: tripartite tricarboxylate transporter permease [Rhodospirillales bacterium]|nr:tripartite tricarboxylate transporter permease [Rhodospirillales bacterium]
MDILSLLAQGFQTVLFNPLNLFIMVIGLALGLIVAVLPGLTLVMGVVLALPFTYGMGILPAIILLTAMYVSGTYGGAFTSILFRIPGEPMDVPLLWDGYTMARRGEPALALGWTLFSAFAGGLVAAVAMVILSGPVAMIALALSTPEYFAIILLGLMSVVTLAGGALAKALISLCIGLLLATVGTDPTYGNLRYDFNVPALADGVDYLLVMIGAYGLGEVLTRMEQRGETAGIARTSTITTRLPNLAAVLKTKWTFVRGSIVGFIIGVVPGAGATIASFVSYGIEGQYGKNRRQLGSGIAEGIIAPQTAATSSVGGAMVPLLTMGIPGSGATAIILAAFMLHGVQPGPHVFFKSADLVYAIFASIFVAVIGMCIIGYFAIKLLVKVLEFPEAITSAFVVMFCFMGALASRSTTGDLWLIAAFGILGYLFERYRFPIAPMVLGAILGPLAESNFMTTMISFTNDWTVFFTRPISGSIMAFNILTLTYTFYNGWRSKRG